MTQAFPMSPTPVLDPLIDPADEEHLEAEAERVFSPLKGQLPDDVMALLQNVFVIVAATHPNAIRARKRAKEGGPVLRTGVEAKEAPDGAAREAKGRAR
jgi:hypothetical protein